MEILKGSDVVCHFKIFFSFSLSPSPFPSLPPSLTFLPTSPICMYSCVWRSWSWLSSSFALHFVLGARLSSGTHFQLPCEPRIMLSLRWRAEFSLHVMWALYRLPFIFSTSPQAGLNPSASTLSRPCWESFLGELFKANRTTWQRIRRLMLEVLKGSRLRYWVEWGGQARNAYGLYVRSFPFLPTLHLKIQY